MKLTAFITYLSKHVYLGIIGGAICFIPMDFDYSSVQAWLKLLFFVIVGSGKFCGGLVATLTFLGKLRSWLLSFFKGNGSDRNPYKP